MEARLGKGKQTSKVTTLKRKLQGCRLSRPHWDQPCDTVISERVPRWSIKEGWGTPRAPWFPCQPLIDANTVFLGQVFWNQSLMGWLWVPLCGWCHSSGYSQPPLNIWQGLSACCYLDLSWPVLCPSLFPALCSLFTDFGSTFKNLPES